MPGRAALIRRARAAAQLLDERAERTPVEIVGHLLAVQAQDLRSAKLALWARGRGFDASDVDAALADGSLLVSWLLRGTLHLVRAAKAHAAMTGRDYVVPDDVSTLAVPVLAHRLLPTVEATMSGRSTAQTLSALVASAPVPSREHS